MKEYNWSTIEKYFEGDLSPSELAAFETLMKNGKDFKEIVDLYEEIENSLTSRANNQKEENDLRNTFEDLGKVYIKSDVNEKKSKIFSLKRISTYLVAASLVVFASLFYYNNSKISYSDFANHPNIDLVVRGNTNEHLVKAQDAFNVKNYKLAATEFQIIIDKDATKVDLQLYLAISLIEQNKFVLADSILEKIKVGKSIYKNKAIWYLALSKLKQKKYVVCKEILMTLPKESEDYEKAKKIINKL